MGVDSKFAPRALEWNSLTKFLVPRSAIAPLQALPFALPQMVNKIYRISLNITAHGLEAMMLREQNKGAYRSRARFIS